jgi:hypothetical protein
VSSMQAWFVPVEGEPQNVLLPMKDCIRHVSQTYFAGRTLDFTRVRFEGRLCTMAVDDTGMCDGLPVNPVATEAYHANCRPGTLYSIHGPAVIFAGVLP